jgi:hypothetical protein
MIAFLVEMRKYFQNVDQRLTATIGSVELQHWGVTSEVVDAWYEDMLGQVARGEVDVPLSTIQSARKDMLRRVTQATS